MPREEPMQGTEAINSLRTRPRINALLCPKRTEAVDELGVY